ncbi:MAG: hypothetical protein E7086_05495 [Bacteroidales bacterium]|nr:hypothetical protein [Bacteroidales bacterium]
MHSFLLVHLLTELFLILHYSLKHTLIILLLLLFLLLLLLVLLLLFLLLILLLILLLVLLLLLILLVLLILLLLLLVVIFQQVLHNCKIITCVLICGIISQRFLICSLGSLQCITQMERESQVVVGFCQFTLVIAVLDCLTEHSLSLLISIKNGLWVRISTLHILVIL